VNEFAIQIDKVDGSTLHLFASGEDAYREAVALRDGWRGEGPNKFWGYVMDGERKRLYMRDIRDVQVVTS
jgi:hypothetical protein